MHGNALSSPMPINFFLMYQLLESGDLDKPQVRSHLLDRLEQLTPDEHIVGIPSDKPGDLLELHIK
jgi:hypothetical protein